MRSTIVSLILLLMIGGFGLLFGYAYVTGGFEAAGPLDQETTLVIPSGTGVDGIATSLLDAGIIDDPIVFKLGVRLSDKGRQLKAGEYRFQPGMSPKAVMDLLVSGQTVQRRITVAEGLTTSQVLRIVADTEGLAGSISIVPDEGSLLPETYSFQKGDTRDAVLTRMTEAMSRTLAELWPTRAEGLPFDTPEEAVILASVVEKETGVAEERARVAAVFVNRLKVGMPLQSDPTVIYGLTEGAGALGRQLLRKDLAVDHPYNTYVHKGLPAGPICNPGRHALAAVLNPAETDEYYFVADGTGGHAFARTLDEHNRNVAKWRRIRREQQGE